MAGNDSGGVSSYLDWSDKGKPAIWWYVVGSLLGIAIILVFSGIGSLPLILLRPDYRSSLVLSVTAMLLNFVISFFTLPLLAQVLHSRPFLPYIINIAALGGTILAALPYMISGVLYGWAAYGTGSLWMSVGLHLINNYTSLVLIGTKGDVLPSAAPFQTGVPGLTIITVAVAVQSAATAAVLIYLLRRRGH